MRRGRCAGRSAITAQREPGCPVVQEFRRSSKPSPGRSVRRGEARLRGHPVCLIPFRPAAVAEIHVSNLVAPTVSW